MSSIVSAKLGEISKVSLHLKELKACCKELLGELKYLSVLEVNESISGGINGNVFLT